MQAPKRSEGVHEATMIKLYHARRTRFIRIVWLLEDLGIPYELATVAFNPPRHAFEQNIRAGQALHEST